MSKRSEYMKKWCRTKKGLACKIHSSQTQKSKRRGHPKPSYTIAELRDWLMSQTVFHTLYEAWQEANYPTKLIPSCDRIHNDKPYSLNNLQLTSWELHEPRNNTERKAGMYPNDIRTVKQYDLNNSFIAEFISTKQAARHTNSNSGCISLVCNGKRKTHNNFIWRY